MLLCLIFSYKFMKKKSECLGIYHYRWQKIGKMMKLCIILVCLFSFSLSATTLAQRERVSMKLQEVSLRQVLELYVLAWECGVKTVYYVRSKSLEVEECESCSS